MNTGHRPRVLRPPSTHCELSCVVASSHLCVSIGQALAVSARCERAPMAGWRHNFKYIGVPGFAQDAHSSAARCIDRESARVNGKAMQHKPLANRADPHKERCSRSHK